jgi:two-component system, chemotaxis family, sensor kinase CheA
MSFGDDEDILQDFLVEAGEIIERLSQQLVDLEQRPDDTNLLNAIFRGFHTVKGGAGFLSLLPMVQCCHLTENLFDILRTGKRSVTPELMDVVLQALDIVNTQFNIVNARGELPPVDPALISALERLVSCEDLNEPAQQTQSSAKPQAQGDITDTEFEELLDAISDDVSIPNTTSTPSTPVSQPSAASASSDDISDDEFEALLDKLHGKGKAPNLETNVTVEKTPSVASVSVGGAPGDEISDDEFESLLDQLHGKGQGPTKGGQSNSSSSSSTKSASSSAPTGANADKTDFIDDNEFESLLDQLHGKGKAPTSSASNKTTAADAPPPPPPKPAAKIEAVAPKATTPASKVEPASAAAKAEPSKAGANAAPAADKDQGIETTVRVDTQRLDDIMNMVGELVLVRNRLMRLGNASGNEPLIKAVANLDVVTADLQTSVMKTRMQPIKKVFGRFPRVVRDLARNLKKEINLELVGEETDLDKNLVEALADPLVHLVRNSVDHGVEFPDVREANGKSRTGLVILSAQQEGDHILLVISDDGAGMDPNKLRRVAVDKGLYDEDSAARLTDVEAFNLIFAPGFSTKKEISDVSGRGVGMDVVKTKINQLNGTVEIQSVLGKGTRFIIKVPLTLAIMPTLMIMIGAQTFALPLASVNEIFHMDLSKSHVVDGQDCIAIRDQAIPLFYMKDWLVKNGTNEPRQRFAHVVIVTVGTRRVGFVVDQLIGQEEVVIKPLGKMLQGTPGMAGATITGDGTIALILDIPSLLRRYARGNVSWGHT